MGSPILFYEAGGGAPVAGPPFVPAPVSGELDSGITQLVSGQSYIDVVFDTPQADTNWTTQCSVDDVLDVTPLNIWPGIVTSKSITGFRLQLNGMPDSGNYYLYWGISAAVGIPSATPATTYSFAGPTTGAVGAPKTYTVALPVGTSVAAPVTVTPSDLGGGGAFSPTSVILTTAAPLATFTYTPGTVGMKTLAVTNSGGLVDPSSIAFNATAFSTAYTLSGPSSGNISVPSTNFTVALPGGGTLASPVVITPSDAGAGGTFTPTTVTISTGTPSATFTYTPASYGAKTISTTNGGGLTDPGSVTYTSLAGTYTFTGPSSGAVSAPSTNFTVALPTGGVLLSTVTVTPSDAGAGGTFTPTTVNLSTGAPSATFTYTPTSSGAKTLSVTNSGTLTNPGNLTYTAGAAGLSDGDPVSSWLDSSGNGHTANHIGTPIFKVNIVNSKPVVRLLTASAAGFNLASIVSGAFPWCAFAVVKQATSNADELYSLVGNDSTAPRASYFEPGGGVRFIDRSRYDTFPFPTVAFHVFTVNAPSAGATTVLIDGVLQTSTGIGGTLINAGNFDKIGYENLTPTYSNGDIAEIVICQGVTLSSTDMQNAEATLAAKYGTPAPPAGSVIDLATLPGLQGWWKADSL